jgi:hypothetical protein
MSEGESNTGKTLLPTAVGWIALVALGGYTIFLHQGLGSAPGGWASLWWQPTSFLLLNPTVGGWAGIPLFGTLMLSVPAIALAAAVLLGTRSSIARTLAVSLTFSAAIFCGVSFTAGGTWELFHWRLSVVLISIGLAIGTAIMSPALSRALVRRGVFLGLVLYVPIAFAVIALMRNATGTDENLTANFSPWPGITVFGLEMGAYTVVGGLLGLSIGLAGLTQLGRRAAVVLLGVLAGVVFPAIWFHLRFSNTEAGPLVGIAILSAIALGLASITRGGDRAATLTRRAAYFALGASLVLIPIFAGRAWAAADYTVNKFVRARIVSKGLASYYAKEGVYPDSLGELTDQNYLEVLPLPRVGFDILYDTGFLPTNEFEYRGLGSSYVLEFNSTEWVQCAYNPPWDDAAGGSEYDDEEYKDEYAGEDDESGEAWSCPDTRPALWGNKPEGDEYEDEYEEDEDEE